jgi:streptogramin lyase
MCAYKDHLYICDRNNDRIVIYDPRNKKFSMFLSPVFEEGRLRRPFSATIDDNDNIYIADRDNDKVQNFDRKGVFKETLGPFDRPSAILVRNKSIYVLERSGSGISTLCCINNGKREYAKFNPPLNHARDMAADSNGDIYITDTYNRQIRKLDRNMKTTAAFDMAGISADQRIQIKGLAIEKDVVFAADFDGFRIFKLDANGRHLGTIELNNKIADADKLRSVSVIDGRIITCVKGKLQVHILDINGNIISSFGERGKGPYSFRNPTKAVRMNCGDILLVDKENDRIVRYNKDWEYISVIGKD